MCPKPWIVPMMLAALGGCAMPAASPDFAAQNRPLEARCFRLQAEHGQAPRKPGLTRAEVQAEARAAAERGELDKVCNSL